MGKRLILPCLTACLLAACASLDTTKTPPIATTSHAVTAADYPAESVKLGEQGATRIRYVVLKDGTVGNVEILKSSGSARLDQASIALAKSKWRFQPATANGKPIQVALPAEIVFALSPTPASYVIVAPDHVAPNANLSPEAQKLIARIHDLYEEIERKQAGQAPAKNDAERLIRMGELDQGVRFWISTAAAFEHLGPDSEAAWAEINRHDLANQAALKAMLPAEGWFLKSKYGPEAVQAAFDIVYHAVNDKDLQRSVLTALGPLVDQGEIRAQAYGMLYDRIAAEDGRPQRYGSAFVCRDGKPALSRLEDPEHVNLFRNTMGFALTVEENSALIAKAHPCG